VLIFWGGEISSDTSLYRNVIPKHLDVKDGLSNNYIVDIVQDGKGLIWVATEAGLNRFDEKHLTTYTKHNSGVVSNELNTLLYDKTENTIWIGSQREGLSIFDCHSQTFKNYTMDNGLITNDVTDLTHAADGGIWIIHYHVGVEHYDKKTEIFTLYANRDIKEMKSQNWCACDDGNGHLYVGHANDGISIIDIRNRTARNLRHQPDDPKSLPGNQVRSICIDHQKNIWVGTNHGLALYNPHTDEFITFRHDPLNPYSLGADHIYHIREMKDGTLWISTDMSGISILDLSQITLVDPRKVAFQNLVASNRQHRLASSNIRCIFQDIYRNIWIGHYRGGVDFISNQPTIFQSLSLVTENTEDENEKQIWDLCLDKEQHLWVGGENEICLFRDLIPKFTLDIRPHLIKEKTGVYVNKITCDRKGSLWIGTNNDGLLKLDPRSFFEDTDGKLWIGTENGLFSCSSDIVRKEDHINNQISDHMVYCILRDKQGKLWIGTFGKGIFIFDEDEQLIANITQNNGLFSNAINSLYMDTGGGIWAATRNGIAHFNDSDQTSQFNIYKEEYGLENTHIRAIQEDLDGNIWISTNTGISLWNKNEERFKNYNYQDGVPMGNFTNGSAVLRNDGMMFFGSLNSICYFNPPDLTEKQKQVSPVQIIDCIVLNKKVQNRSNDILSPLKDNKVDLPYNQNSIRVSFSVPDFSQNEQVEYAYKMDGMDESWRNTLGDNQISFQDLSPGKYAFRVKARLKNQEWDETAIASMRFIIHPPVWLTWYAKLFYALIIGLIIWMIIRSYKRKIALRASLELERKNSQNKQELNDERLRFYTNITHELRTPLTLILGPLEDLTNDNNLPALYTKKIKLIHTSAIRLLKLINQILEFRKTETQNRKLTVTKGNIADLIMETGLRFKELNKNVNVTIHIDIREKEAILYFDTDMITTILNNLLSNAVKYTPAGEIRLSLRSLEEDSMQYTEVEIKDTGYGIDAESLPHIFDRYYQAKGKHQASGTGIGLALVKSLAELHEGVLRVESTIGQGTTFSFRLLTGNTYPHALHDSKKDVCKEQASGNIKLIKESDDNRPVILVIEDDEDIREYISVSLTDSYQIHESGNGKKGLEKALKIMPDLIVSDIMMPVMDGVELCHAIKDDVRTSHIPVVLLTAKDSIRDKEEGYESGADSYLTKPFSARLLQNRIKNLLETRRRMAEQINQLLHRNPVQTTVISDKNTQTTDSLSAQSFPPIPESVKLNPLDVKFLNKLTEIIENNIEMDDLDINFIKEQMNMSYSTFYRKVKGLTHMSPNEFIRNIRLKKSLQLLLTDSYTISEVAYMSGFNDVVYFRKCFKEEFGMTPSEYIKNK
jgi:signal transduction histidine kinase/ligand-binding sensor domain-containing protein/DNA-binding response OmpR family regulator